MQRNLLVQVGVDPNGIAVYAGVFAFYETHGLPLDLILAQLWDRGMVPDWQDLLVSMVRAGRPKDRAVEAILAAIHDACYPMHVRDVIVAKFTLLAGR